MFNVLITASAQAQFLKLPLSMQPRVQDAFARLQRWPDVSGTKPLRGELKGAFRVRCGEWRVLFSIDGSTRSVTVFRIANRRDVYE